MLTRRDYMTALAMTGVVSMAIDEEYIETEWLEVPGTAQIGNVEADNLLTKSTGNDIIIWTDGTTVTAIKDSEILEEGSNAADVIDSVCQDNQTAHIHVGPGSYQIDTSTLSQSWVRLYSTTFEGVDRDGVTFTLADGSNPYAVFRGRDNCTLRNVTVDGNKLNNTSGIGFEANAGSDVAVENCVIRDTVDESVALINACTDVRVIGNAVSGSDTNLIRVVATGARVSLNECTSGGAGGAPATNSGAINGQTCTDIIVSDNVIDGHAGHGVSLGAGTSNSSITGNSVASCQGHGINVSAACTDVTVGNNSVRGCTLSGIDIDTVDAGTPQDSYIAVEGNTSKSNTEHGIVIQNSGYVAINGNVCRGNTQAGIQTNSVNAEYTTIVGNLCSANDRGIDGNTGTNQLVVGNTAVGNTTSQIVNIPVSGVNANNQTA